MNNILSEKEYQHFIMDRLSQDNGYIVRKATSYDRLFAMDRELLFQFLNDTQPDEVAALRKIYKADLEDTLVSFINSEVTKARGSLLDVLKHGIEISNMKLELMYTKPATTFNRELLARYEKNIFSVMEEVWASDDERVDLVIFLNGIAIMSFELKCNAAGQSYQDAIYQYRVDRDPKTRLFWFKAGCLVNFAMDLEQVYMTTKLAGNATFFLPFNMGNGEGVNAGAGNPTFKDKYSVSYMWEDILKKDTVLDLISKFIFIETKESKDELTGKTKKSENIIFPRYHQLDVIRKLLADVRENGSTQNYLIQHSAGSGKTNSIAWLAHRLTSLHDADNKIIFDNVVIVTDRVVVDRQLQKAIMGMEHKAGLIRVMDDKCNSADLAIALNGNTKIIATTIQKFPYIVDSVAGLKGKRFAVIIDEAHSSTAGKDMAAVTMSLGSGDQEIGDVEDMITDEIRRNGKQANVSMFAFTATPKPTTIQLFGRLNTKGQREAFHIYSMKQAIEEGFILDVLQNYTTYDTFYQLNKEIEEDPRCKTADAKRQIARFVELHETNIAQRVEVIVEHFRTTVMPELGGMAKAMVITASRQGAVKYRQAFENYTQKKGYTDIKALVAFSGKVKLPDDDTEYSEASMNGFPEDRLTKEFDKDDYQVLLVANKYQTGFDQPKLCAMYVLKKLKGVSAVQTLSRLNRICPPFEKKTFVLDFVNTYDDIKAAFAPYYTTTLLSTSVTPTAIYDLEAQIDAYTVLDPDDIEKANELLYKGNISTKDKQKLTFYFKRAKNSRIEFVQFHQNYSYEDFMMGYKPVEDGFELKYGIFYRFCQKAANQPDKEFFFIIDEINRGNMSKIFGELLMLIEKDYRGTKATLAYNGLSFSVPKNLYIIGMMNTADRSLAMIDYALRRRFSFFEVEPGFDSEGFIHYQNSLNNETLNELVNKVKDLNREISLDKSLGKGFCIGHSYFCGRDVCTEEWLHSIVDYDILPMLSEYWFDDANKLQRWENILQGVFQ